MSPLRRYFVSVLLAGILAAQVYMTIPPLRDAGGWYWPFVSYPMYRGAHHEGDEMMFTRLEGVPCGGGEPMTLTYEDLGIRWHNLNMTMLSILESPGLGESEPEARLRGLVVEKHSGAVCTARVYSRSLHLGNIPQSGIEGIPWALSAELEIP